MIVGMSLLRGVPLVNWQVDKQPRTHSGAEKAPRAGLTRNVPCDCNDEAPRRETGRSKELAVTQRKSPVRSGGVCHSGLTCLVRSPLFSFPKVASFSLTFQASHGSPQDPPNPQEKPHLEVVSINFTITFYFLHFSQTCLILREVTICIATTCMHKCLDL